jgi:hypothetical protein
MRIVAGVGDLVLRTGDSKHRSDGIVCGLHHAQAGVERGFLGLASKPRSTVSPSLASTLVALGFLIWASKPVGTVL